MIRDNSNFFLLGLPGMPDGLLAAKRDTRTPMFGLGCSAHTWRLSRANPGVRLYENNWFQWFMHRVGAMLHGERATNS